jgi:hypothetical protein
MTRRIAATCPIVLQGVRWTKQKKGKREVCPVSQFTSDSAQQVYEVFILIAEEVHVLWGQYFHVKPMSYCVTIINNHNYSNLCIATLFICITECFQSLLLAHRIMSTFLMLSADLLYSAAFATLSCV